MLRTYHLVPQVTVSINNINSKCTGSCDFQWSSISTPIVNAIDTSQINGIKITGSGFDSINLNNNIVLIGNIYSCNVLSALNTQIICSLGSIPIGTYSFSVNVLNKGLATMNTNTNVNFKLTTLSLSPTSCGTGGGLILNITGTGFNSNCTVLIDNINCPIISIDYSLIKCIIPSNVSGILFLFIHISI